MLSDNYLMRHLSNISINKFATSQNKVPFTSEESSKVLVSSMDIKVNEVENNFQINQKIINDVVTVLLDPKSSYKLFEIKDDMPSPEFKQLIKLLQNPEIAKGVSQRIEKITDIAISNLNTDDLNDPYVQTKIKVIVDLKRRNNEFLEKTVPKINSQRRTLQSIPVSFKGNVQSSGEKLVAKFEDVKNEHAKHLTDPKEYVKGGVEVGCFIATAKLGAALGGAAAIAMGLPPELGREIGNFVGGTVGKVIGSDASDHVSKAYDDLLKIHQDNISHHASDNSSNQDHQNQDSSNSGSDSPSDGISSHQNHCQNNAFKCLDPALIARINPNKYTTSIFIQK